MIAARKIERETGTVICEGEIAGRAVPWKAPTLTKNGGVNYNSRGYGTYQAWKQLVNLVAHTLTNRRRPYGGPVALDVTFYLHPKKGRPPDRSNLLKAFEDALQGVLIQNDSQIEDGNTRRIIDATEAQRVEFKITAL